MLVEAREVLAETIRRERVRLLATVMRHVSGDFDAAEEVLQETFAAAAAQWPQGGVPREPLAWLFRAAHHKAIDHVRGLARARRHARALSDEAAAQETSVVDAADGRDHEEIPDDRLRLIFTCCHPVLPLKAQVALTLRTLCGLSTEAIADAFLVPESTMAQRLVRAKAKLREAAVPYRVPEGEALAERLDAVLGVVYLVFTEGYAASRGDSLVRRELCDEAIRLARVLVVLVPGEAECEGLLALLLLTDARRESRVDPDGELVLLEDQDRSRWNPERIREGMALVARAFSREVVGPYALQAAIAAEHSGARRAVDTRWSEIEALYAELEHAAPSPIVSLNHAVAVAMARGADAGIALLDAMEARGELVDCHLLFAARADLQRRMGRVDAARKDYTRAIALVTNDAERRFLARRLEGLAGGT